jgi:excisionase family DNA binding protein
MKEEPDQSEPVEKQLTVGEAAEALGVDTFTVFSLIQRGNLISARARGGEITVPASKLAKLTGKGR